MSGSSFPSSSPYGFSSSFVCRFNPEHEKDTLRKNFQKAVVLSEQRSIVLSELHRSINNLKEESGNTLNDLEKGLPSIDKYVKLHLAKEDIEMPFKEKLNIFINTYEKYDMQAI